MSTTAEDIIKASASVARDAAEGRLNPSTLDQAVTDECRGLFGTVAGPGDPLWPLHVDIARQVLGLDGIPVIEMAEWLAAARKRETAVDTPSQAISSASEPYSLDLGDYEPGPETGSDS